MEDQATDRARRIRQTCSVFVHRLVSSGRVEERIDEMIGRQRGRRYARQRQVVSLDVSPGLLTAQVQGSRRTPYVVTLVVCSPSWRTSSPRRRPPCSRALAGPEGQVQLPGLGQSLPHISTDLIR